MNCEDVLRYLSDYIDNNLEESLAEEARQHLATCPNCQIVLDSIQKTILLCRKTGTKTLTLDRRSQLFDQIKQTLHQNKE